MREYFALLVDALKIAFEDSVGEAQYHDLVAHIRNYAAMRDPDYTFMQGQVMRDVGWPENYDPCNHNENIRFCMRFGAASERLCDVLLHMKRTVHKRPLNIP
jgi:hypothetical protein